MDNDYEVGYGKPPAQHRFKPGVSGNRYGRPKGSKNTYTLLNEILDQRITIKENGESFKVSKRAAMLTQLVNKGVKGDTKAIAVLLPHLLVAEMKEEEKNSIMKALHTDDQAIIAAYLASSAGIEATTEDDHYEDEQPYPELEC